MIRRLAEAEIFLENQIIEDFENIEKLKSITKNYVDLGPMSSTMVNDDNARDVLEDGNIVDKLISDNGVLNELVE